jgi:hypothetical protein
MSWPRRHPHIAIWLLNGILIAAVLISIEFRLRTLGYSYTQKPEQLVLEDTFMSNDEGLFVANPDSVTHQHSGISVNRDGFRSPEFYPLPNSTSTSVVLLGDSFAWGANAIPLSQSFADLLRAEGYVVHNLGIPGTGPRQYRMLAEKYIPLLKPDVVIVALYLGNDVLAMEPTPPLGKPLYYVVKGGGWITPFDENGNYIESVTIAYEYQHNKFGRVRRFLRETTIGTLLIKDARSVMARRYEGKAQPVSLPELQEKPDQQNAGLLARYAHTYTELRSIQALAENSGSRFYTLVLPALGEGCLTSPDFSLNAQRTPLKTFQPVFVELSNYHYNPVSDCHLNNEGHAVVARGLTQLLGVSSRENSDNNSKVQKRRKILGSTS